MHDIRNPLNQINQKVVEDKELLGKECCCCFRILEYSFFTRDSTYRDGHRDRCFECETSPRMSTAEHTARLREMNLSSEAVKRQRWGKDQLDYMLPEKVFDGQYRHHSWFLPRLRQLLSTNRLYVRDGRFIGDLAAYRVYGKKQKNGRDFKYLFYIPTGWLPEFSTIQFDGRAVPLRVKRRGWRSVLEKLIKTGLVSENEVNAVFGRPTETLGSLPYRRELWKYRNRKEEVKGDSQN